MKTIAAMVMTAFVVAAAAYAADDPKLAAQAKVSESDARASALGRVKDGIVKAEELEREHGHLIYSYDISVAGKSGIDEVAVDAVTGKVLSVKHETPKQERAEAAADKKAAGKKAKH